MANDNAVAWRNLLEREANISKERLEELCETKALLKDLLDTGDISCGARRRKVRKLLKE